jgi:hypothetical protein
LFISPRHGPVPGAGAGRRASGHQKLCRRPNAAPAGVPEQPVDVGAPPQIAKWAAPSLLTRATVP